MNSTVDDRMAGGHNLDEPHFDEEATILARPVVPLDEVKAEKRSKAGVAVALAIGGGLLMGLLAATLIYRYLGASQAPRGETATVAEQPASPAGEQTPNQLPGAAGGAVGVDDSAVTNVEEEQPADADTETSGLEPGNEESKPVRTQDRAPEVAPRRPIVVRESPPPVDEDDDESERAIRRTERQEERRERRRAVREARRQQRQPNQTADDLTRIREIFEGAPKP